MALVSLMTLAAIGAIGLNILVGYTGQGSVGHGAFMMVGSYTAALLTVRLGAPFWLGLPAGGGGPGAVGDLFGISSLPLKGAVPPPPPPAGPVIIWVIRYPRPRDRVRGECDGSS